MGDGREPNHICSIAPSTRDDIKRRYATLLQSN